MQNKYSKEAKFPVEQDPEYAEGSMAKNELKAIVEHAQDLDRHLDDNTKLEPWVETKITKAKDYILTVTDYLLFSEEHEQGEGHEGGEEYGSYFPEEYSQADEYGDWHGEESEDSAPELAEELLDCLTECGYPQHVIDLAKGLLGEIQECETGEAAHEERMHGYVTAAKYQGKTVKLNKPMKGDVKKFKVYVKNQKGKVVKVNFGDPNMEIKRDDPKRRKNFRARHRCQNPGPKWKARYWSCRMWGKTPVSKLTSSIDYRSKIIEAAKKKPKGLWYNIQKKRERGEAPAKPGQEGYPDKENWDKLTK